MTVRELIEALEKHPDDVEVVVEVIEDDGQVHAVHAGPEIVASWDVTEESLGLENR